MDTDTNPGDDKPHGPQFGLLDVDWGEPDPGAAARDKAAFRETQQRVMHADPATLSQAERFAQRAALQRERADSLGLTGEIERLSASGKSAATIATELGQRLAPALDGTKGKTAARDFVTAIRASLDIPDKKTQAAEFKKWQQAYHERHPEAAPPLQAVRKGAGRAKPIELQPPPAPGGSDIPPITPEAIEYLANKMPTPDAFAKLDPASKKFVEHHYRHQEKVDSAVKGALPLDLEDHAPPLAVSRTVQPLQEPAMPPSGTVTFDLDPDTRNMNSVISTSHTMQAAQVGEVTRDVVFDLVTGDVAAVRAIKDERMRQAALSATVESALSQPAYQSEFARLAPDLIEPAKAAYAAYTAQLAQMQAGREPAPPEREEAVENSLERGPVQVKQPAAVVQVEKAEQAAPKPGWGARMLGVIDTLLRPRADPGTASKLVVPAAAPAAPDPKLHTIPAHVTKLFLQGREKHYYFPDGKTHAFTDRGNKLTTRHHHPEVVKSLVDIAIARGWDSVTVKGSEEFRRAGWMQAAQAGLKVAGYEPTPLDLAQLQQKEPTNALSKGIAPEKRVTLDKEAAPVDRAAQEMATAFDKYNPSYGINKYPQLAGAYGWLAAARVFADEKLPAPNREQFVGLVRRHVVEQIAAGTLPEGPPIYVSQEKAKEAAVPGKSRERGKGVAQER
jgi:hypothetical protein